MINFQFNIRNPFLDRFENIFAKGGPTPFEHKYWEFQIIKTSDIIDLGFRWTHWQDHAGVQVTLGLFGYGLDFNFYDNRHWNDETKDWEKYHG